MFRCWGDSFCFGAPSPVHGSASEFASVTTFKGWPRGRRSRWPSRMSVHTSGIFFRPACIISRRVQFALMDSTWIPCWATREGGHFLQSLVHGCYLHNSVWQQGSRGKRHTASCAPSLLIPAWLLRRTLRVVRGSVCYRFCEISMCGGRCVRLAGEAIACHRSFRPYLALTEGAA